MKSKSASPEQAKQKSHKGRRFIKLQLTRKIVPQKTHKRTKYQETQRFGDLEAISDQHAKLVFPMFFFNCKIMFS